MDKNKQQGAEIEEKIAKYEKKKLKNKQREKFLRKKIADLK